MMVLLSAAGLASAVLAQTGFEIARGAYLLTADQRDGTGVMRVAERQLRDAVNAINIIAGEVSQRDVVEGYLPNQIEIALTGISLARERLASAEWTIDNQELPWEVLYPLLPIELADAPDLRVVTGWMIQRLDSISFGLKDWTSGQSPPGLIYTIQTEAALIHQILARATGAQEVPPLKDANLR